MEKKEPLEPNMPVIWHSEDLYSSNLPLLPTMHFVLEIANIGVQSRAPMRSSGRIGLRIAI